MNILYVCNDFPYPPTHGGRVDMWNRIRAFARLNVKVDVIATVGQEPQASDQEEVAKIVNRLIILKRRSLWAGLLSFKPTQVAIRRDLSAVKLTNTYDLVLMQSEVTTDILMNQGLRVRRSVIRVDNDEAAYSRKSAKAVSSPVAKFYYWQESIRMKRHSRRRLAAADMLWFVSQDELSRYRSVSREPDCQRTAFVPAGIDMCLASEPRLAGSQVLFVGSLWVPLNRGAIEWFVHKVHPLLSGVRGYSLAIAGSTNGKPCEWLSRLIESHANISIHLDEDDLTLFYRSSAVFINPMQDGAGVKLKTVEAALRGIPIVSTKAGAEGTGFVDGIHLRLANTVDQFANAVKDLLFDKTQALALAREAQQFVTECYDQDRILAKLLAEAS